MQYKHIYNENLMNKKANEGKEIMEQISLKLPKSLIEKYNRYAQTKSNPRSHFMREALVEYIERKEKNNREK